MSTSWRKKVLDHGYVALVETWGSDGHIIEAARMSTGKGFIGWGGQPCPECLAAGRLHPEDNSFLDNARAVSAKKCVCKGTGKTSGDEKLLRYLYKHKHMTPFEMAGMTVEVKAPIFVFREWHRHRTQSYNELSARYVPLPDENYLPTYERIIRGAQATGNRQAEGAAPLAREAVSDWLKALQAAYAGVEMTYQTGLAIGIPKELARLCLPVGRYSRMRASANLRNWLQFLTLRMGSTAQWEIQQYANTVSELVKAFFPYTHELFMEG